MFVATFAPYKDAKKFKKWFYRSETGRYPPTVVSEVPHRDFLMMIISMNQPFGGTCQDQLTTGYLSTNLGRSNRETKSKIKKGVFFRPVYNSSFSPPYRGIYTILFDTRCYNGFFARPARKIHYSAPRDIIHADYNTAAALHCTCKHWYSSVRPKPLRK